MNRMTLDQLRVSVAVAERQHLTRAAEALNLAQSAVSSAISLFRSRLPKHRWVAGDPIQTGYKGRTRDIGLL